MIKLPEQFKRKGMMYFLEARNDFVALYRVHQLDPDRIIGYEVWKVRVAKESEMFDKIIEEREIKPSDEDFGTYAWSFDTYHRAYGCYEAKTLQYQNKKVCI